jgi:tight adherence protein B
MVLGLTLSGCRTCTCGRSAKAAGTLEEQLPESLDFLSRSMRAGHAFSISLEMVGEEMADPLGQEFRALFNEQNLGAPLDVACAISPTRVPLLDVRFFTSSVLLQSRRAAT